jgi:hypothetical protein
MSSAQEIVRCIRKDYGTSPKDLRAGAAYCERIGRNALRNPWAPPEDAGNYLEAARALEAQAKETEEKNNP